MAIKVIGAGSVPTTSGRILSSGMWRVVLTLDEDRVSVEVRDNWLNKLLRPRGPFTPKHEGLPIRWSARWDELTGVDAARYSLLFYVDQQPRSRFLGMTHRGVTVVVRELAGHGVSVHAVRTTAKFLLSHPWG